MAPRSRPQCGICTTSTSKYACPRCNIPYCSVPCYKSHKESSHPDSSTQPESQPQSSSAHSKPILELEPEIEPEQKAPSSNPSSLASLATPSSAASNTSFPAADNDDEEEEDKLNHAHDEAPLLHVTPTPPLRALSSLKWPYVPDVSAYPDPLTRDDPQPLTLAQYEAIATASPIRTALHAHPRLPTLLRALDALRGKAREEALERVLGVASGDVSFHLGSVGAGAGDASGDADANVGVSGGGMGAGAGGTEMVQEIYLGRSVGNENRTQNRSRNRAQHRHRHRQKQRRPTTKNSQSDEIEQGRNDIVNEDDIAYNIENDEDEAVDANGEEPEGDIDIDVVDVDNDNDIDNTIPEPLYADAEDVRALRTLAAAIEAAVRSRAPRTDVIGLDWG